jgi:rod shape-determining protein MreC
VNDQTSGAGVILETTRIRGILRGNADGQLMIVGILADERIQPGEKVLTAGGDLIFPRGLPVGVVEKVNRDPDRDAFIDVMVKPAAHLDQLDEVLIITSTQPRFSPQEQKDIDASAALQGADSQTIEEQMKASQINAEKLPGVNETNAPAGSAPAGQNGANPNAVEPPAPKLLPTLHPDRFSPGAATTPGAATGSGPDANSPPKAGAAPAAQPGSHSGAGRNP